MVHVHALVRNSVLQEITAEGHAGELTESGRIACAAVSTLLRTAGRLLELEEEVSLTGTAKKPGDFKLQLTAVGDNKREWLKGITDYLIIGLKIIEQDYPEKIKLDLRIT